MNRVRFSGLKAAVALLLVLGHIVFAPLAASAATNIVPPPVPTDIAVPAGYVLLFSSHATGVQTYECRDGQWVFRAPRALLLDPETAQPTALHYGGVDRQLTPGPWWDAMRDDSRIRGGRPVAVPSPNPNSIPLLRLEVLERQGTGIFSRVSYIQRLNTVGGVGPTGACFTAARRLVDYTADYYFYGTP